MFLIMEVWCVAYSLYIYQNYAISEASVGQDS